MNQMSITALNTMSQLQKQLDIISNNIANIDTTGYKKQNASFSELLVQQYNNQPAEENETELLTAPGVRMGTGAQIGQVQTIYTQGSVVDTDRTLDFALTSPNQFFKVLAQTGNEMGVQYTRDGAFYLSPISDNESALVTSDGYQVLDENNNPIIVDKNLTNVNLTDQGQITFSNEAGQSETVALGIIQIDQPQVLTNAGNNLLAIPDSLNMTEDQIGTNLQGADRAQISLKQQALEQSNVDLTEEMTKLMQTQRSYQFQARAMSLSDQMQGLINGIR